MEASPALYSSYVGDRPGEIRIGDGDRWKVGDVGTARGEGGDVRIGDATDDGAYIALAVKPAPAGVNDGVTKGEMGAMGNVCFTLSGRAASLEVPGAGHYSRLKLMAGMTMKE